MRKNVLDIKNVKDINNTVKKISERIRPEIDAQYSRTLYEWELMPMIRLRRPYELLDWTLVSLCLANLRQAQKYSLDDLAPFLLIDSFREKVIDQQAMCTDAVNFFGMSGVYSQRSKLVDREDVAWIIVAVRKAYK